MPLLCPNPSNQKALPEKTGFLLSPKQEILLRSGTLLGNYPTVSLCHYEQLNASENHLAENVICPRFERREYFS